MRDECSQNSVGKEPLWAPWAVRIVIFPLCAAPVDEGLANQSANFIPTLCRALVYGRLAAVIGHVDGCAVAAQRV